MNLVIKVLLIAFLVVPLALVVGVIAAPFFVVDTLRERAWRRRHEGALLLVCTRRRGWYDFTVNHLIPALPEGTIVRWWRPGRTNRRPRWLSRLYGAGIYGVPKPFLVLVTRRGLRHSSLNADLQSLKEHPARSGEIRRRCAAVVGRALADLRKRA